MGFFSWITQDTDKSIPNIYSGRDIFRVVMHDNKGNKWIEDLYDGYCEFGGKDFYELLAEMNGKTTREEGVDIAFSGEPYISPNLTETLNWDWINSEPKICPDQGYFYTDNEEEDYE